MTDKYYTTRSRWLTCDTCGENRDTSSMWTSPENHTLDRIEWETVHVPGLCAENGVVK